MELVMERLEVQCSERIQELMKQQEQQNLEFDENVICDVCRQVRKYISLLHRRKKSYNLHVILHKISKDLTKICCIQKF